MVASRGFVHPLEMIATERQREANSKQRMKQVRVMLTLGQHV